MCTRRVLEFVASKDRQEETVNGIQTRCASKTKHSDKISENSTSFRNGHGHYWSLRTRNLKAFPLSPFCRILETNILAHGHSSLRNIILFMSWIRLRSFFRTKLTTIHFRPDGQTDVMRGL